MPSPDLILKHCVVAIADDLEDYDWREEKVRQWVSYHGGKFSSTVEANVTHLLCTEANFKKKVAAVQTALKTKDTKIVMRDWLEDSINKRTCLKTHKYDLTEQFKHEGAQKRKAKETEKNSKLSENYVDPGTFFQTKNFFIFFRYKLENNADGRAKGSGMSTAIAPTLSTRSCSRATMKRTASLARSTC
jgi:hypothetical protein